MNHLTSEQRYEIYLGLKRGWTKTFIAKEIGVHPSTVCREIKRNSNSRGEYVWLTAQKECEQRKHGFAGNNSKPPELWWRIDQMIMEDWSPAVISGVLGKEGISICKQTIYNHVHGDTTGRLAFHMPMNSSTAREPLRTNPQRLPILPTAHQYTTAPPKLMESDSETGRWISSSIPSAMQY